MVRIFFNHEEHRQQKKGKKLPGTHANTKEGCLPVSSVHKPKNCIAIAIACVCLLSFNHPPFFRRTSLSFPTSTTRQSIEVWEKQTTNDHRKAWET